MASSTQKTKARRNRKDKPHKANRKADMKRTQNNRKILKELAAEKAA